MVGHGMWPFGLLSVPRGWRWGSLAMALHWRRTYGNGLDISCGRKTRDSM